MDNSTEASEIKVSENLLNSKVERDWSDAERASPESVSALFRPRSIAVVGASSNPTRFSGKIIPTLIRQGFTGAIYPVNAGRAEIAGLTCYPDISSIPGQVDCVVYAVGAEHLVPMLPDIAAKGVRLLVVSSSGFAERGDDVGRALQDELVSFARRHGIRVLGPNCIGFTNFAARTCVSSAAALEWPNVAAGGIGLVSQSGGLGLATILYCALEQGIGFSNIVTTGNEADLDTIDIARSFVDDPATQVIAMTVEAVRDTSGFVSFLALSNAAGKPVIVLKSGRTELGKTMAASHTGALAGSAAVFESVCTRFGVICAHDVDDLIEFAAMFAKLRAAGKLSRAATPASGAAALSISGGHIGLYADHASAKQLAFPAFAPETHAAISQELGFHGNFQNPLDTTARTIGDDGFWGRVTRVVLNDPRIDVVTPIITVAHSYDRAVDDFIAIADETDKTLIVLWAGGHFEGEGRERLQRSLVPVFRTPARVASAIAALDRYCRVRNRQASSAALAATPTQASFLQANAAAQHKARALLMTHAGDHRPSLNERESKEILAALGLRVTREQSVSRVEEAISAARSMGYPVVMKGEHSAILHKSEAGIVFLGVDGDAEVASAFDAIVARMNAAVPDNPTGRVLMQEQIPPGTELMAGVTSDPEFGPVVVVGLGGIFVEIMNDVAMRVPPFDQAEALRMLDELKGAKVLDGVRGRQPVDRTKLAAFLVRLGDFAAMNRDIVKEIDVNPLMALADGSGDLCAVDGLFVLHQTAQSTLESAGGH